MAWGCPQGRLNSYREVLAIEDDCAIKACMKKPGTIPAILLVIGLVAAGAGLSLPLWRPWLHPLLYGETGDSHSTWPMSTISGIVSFLINLLESGGLWGTMLAILAMPGVCALLPEPYRFWRYTLTLAGAGLLFTGISFTSSMEFFFISPGTAIRPMFWYALQIMLLLAGLLVAAIFGCWSVNTTAPRWLRWLGIMLCLAPCPVGIFMLRWAMRENGLTISE